MKTSKALSVPAVSSRSRPVLTRPFRKKPDLVRALRQALYFVMPPWARHSCLVGAPQGRLFFQATIELNGQDEEEGGAQTQEACSTP